MVLPTMFKSRQHNTSQTMNLIERCSYDFDLSDFNCVGCICIKYLQYNTVLIHPGQTMFKLCLIRIIETDLDTNQSIKCVIH